MQLPIGRDDFGKILEKKLDFVDKSLFIQAVMDIESEFEEEEVHCLLMPPNYEVKVLYRGIVKGWLNRGKK
jgi:hypothetical protein